MDVIRCLQEQQAGSKQHEQEHGKPQNTAAGKSRQEHAETQQEAKQEQSLITSYLGGTAVQSCLPSATKGSAVALHVRDVQRTISRGHTREVSETNT